MLLLQDGSGVIFSLWASKKETHYGTLTCTWSSNFLMWLCAVFRICVALHIATIWFHKHENIIWLSIINCTGVLTFLWSWTAALWFLIIQSFMTQKSILDKMSLLLKIFYCILKHAWLSTHTHTRMHTQSYCVHTQLFHSLCSSWAWHDCSSLSCHTLDFLQFFTLRVHSLTVFCRCLPS